MIKVSFEWGLQVEKEGVAMATIFLTGKKLFTFGHYFPDAPRISSFDLRIVIELTCP